jgi:hypothetical protein
MAARSTRGAHPIRQACLIALVVLAGCKGAAPPPPESMSAPAPAASAPAPAAAPDERPEDEVANAQPGPPDPAPVAAGDESGDNDRARAAAGVAPAPTPPATAPAPTPLATAPAPAPPAAGPPATAPRLAGSRKHTNGAGYQRGPSPTSVSPAPADRPVVGAAPAPATEPPDPESGAVRPGPEPGAPPATSPAPAAPAASVEAFYASLPEQAIAFHVPRAVPRGQLFAVRLVVQPGLSEADLARVLVDIAADAGPAPVPGDVRTRATRVGDEMQARLSSPTLQIVPRGDDRQLVRSDAVTEWVWDVTAAKGGAHQLTLSLYAIPQGRGSGIKVKTFEETLTVEVALIDEIKDTLADNWEWMWTFVLGPLGALMWRRRQRRHAHQREPQ